MTALSELKRHLRPGQAYRRKDLIKDFVPYEFGLDPQMKAENFLSHQAKVQSVLIDWAARHGWLTVNANRPAAAVQADMLTVLQDHIESHLVGAG